MTSQQWILMDQWGFATDIPESDLLSYAKALLICVKGDGILAQEERDWVLGYCAAVGAGAATTETLTGYAADEQLLDVVRQNPKLAQGETRPLIFDAIRACSADGEFSEGERTAVRGMASLVGLQDSDVTELERLYEEERAFMKKRAAVVFPGGLPF